MTDNFDHNGTHVTLATRESKMEIFEHLDIIYGRSADSIIRYTVRILKGMDHTKFKVKVKLCK